MNDGIPTEGLMGLASPLPIISTPSNLPSQENGAEKATLIVSIVFDQEAPPGMFVRSSLVIENRDTSFSVVMAANPLSPPNNIHNFRLGLQIRLHRPPHPRPLLKGIRHADQPFLAEPLPDEADPKGQVRPLGDQVSEPVHHHRLAGRVLAQRHRDDGGAHDGRERRREGGGQDERVERVVPQRARHAQRAREVPVARVVAPELGRLVAPLADDRVGDRLVPQARVALRPHLQGLPLRERADGLQVRHVVRVGRQLGEEALEPGHQVGLEEERDGVAVDEVGAREDQVVDEGGAGLLEERERGVERGDEDAALGARGAGEEVAGDADALAGQATRVLARADVVRHPVEREYVRRVLDRAGHGAHGVLVLGQGHDQVPRREAGRGLDADQVVHVRRRQNRAAGLRAQGGQREAQRAGDAAARGRPGGVLPRVIRALDLAPVGRPPVAGPVAAEVGPLGQIRLTEDHGARPPEPGRHGAVRGHPGAEQGVRPGRGVHPAVERRVGRDVVLQQQRDPVQRAPHLAAGPLAVQGASGGAGRGVQLRDGVQLAVDLGDARRVRVHEVDAREEPGAQACHQVFQAGIDKGWEPPAVDACCTITIGVQWPRCRRCRRRRRTGDRKSGAVTGKCGRRMAEEEQPRD
ncbi:uncharacterized protein E0L32_011242 [Thyridium curvatum]|uniref:Uncharacterized protein n=1 Tax=Thyridium curvatum TaxID=1093900 RepID=A0A507BP41_9PEZI|nr:uncharacterized protein E0L32_011242 [Thyridium curvatum]TPX19081.1 hypothetical protein E0L32_011242 [Thyridium curvatum]